jgi:hypothetical protein
MKITAFCLCRLLILTARGVMAQQTTTPNQSSIVPNQSWALLRQLQAGEKSRWRLPYHREREQQHIDLLRAVTDEAMAPGARLFNPMIM